MTISSTPISGRLTRFSFRQGNRDLFVAWIALVVFLSLTGVAWNLSKKNYAAELRHKLDKETQRIESTIQLRLMTCVSALDGASGFFDVNRVVNRSEWQTYFTKFHLSEKYPGLQGVAYVERVSDANKEAFVQKIRNEGFPDFSIKPEGKKDEYYPIIFIQPFNEKNRPAFGFDLMSEPTRREALTRARDSGEIAMSRKLVLRIDAVPLDRPGLMLCQPVYKKDNLRGTPAERRSALRGFLVGGIRINDLLSNETSQFSSDIHLKVFEGNPSDSTLLYDSHPDVDEKKSLSLSLTDRKEVKILGQTWTFTYSVFPSFDDLGGASKPGFILFGGVLLSLLFSGFAGFIIFTKRKALRLADEMTLRMREANAFLEHVLENIPVMTFIKDAKALKFVRINKALEDIVGVPRTEMLGKGDFDFFPKEEAEFFTAKDREVLKGKKLVDIEKEPIQTLRHGPRFLHTRKIPILDAEGNPTHLLGVSEDITDRLQAEEELRSAKDSAESATHAKSRFLANMSHELRTPLNTILNYSGLLEEEAGERGLYDFVKDIQHIDEAGKHLLEIINNILDLSKIEAGKIDIRTEEIDVYRIVLGVVSMTGFLGSKGNNTFHYNCPQDIGTMETDTTKVRQALFNLLSNAYKFTTNGSIHLNVRRENVSGKEWILFDVADTGIGMTEEQMKGLFNDFAQVHDSAQRVFDGTGLGLSLSRRLCRAIGGDITVVSTRGNGSTFTMRIPSKIHEVSSFTRKPDNLFHPVLPAEAVVNPGHDEVLVIEDDKHMQDVIRHYLEKTGFKVRSAFTGDDGLRLARMIQPAVITLDVMMPTKNGWDVLKELKKDPMVANIPVVLITLINDKKTASSLGVKDYLTKPIDFRALVGILKRHSTERGQSVLVVDDDEASRERLCDVLKKNGWEAHEAKNGQEALDILQVDRPVLIILDLMMPQMNGFEFISQLQTNEIWRSIPIVVLTAKDISEEDRRRLDGHVEEVVQKQGQSVEAFVQTIQMKVLDLTNDRRKAV